MIGLQDIDGARVVLDEVLYEVEEIAVGVHFDIVWPDPFAGTDHFFEAIYDSVSGDITGAKALYDLSIIQNDEGSSEELKNISEILRHLSIQKTSNDVPYLHVDIGFAGDSFGTFGGLNPGGSQGGGTLRSLADVALSNSLSNRQILVYDNVEASATRGKWINISPTLNFLSDVKTPNPANGDALVYSSSQNGWISRPASSGTVTSVVLSTGSGNGTMKLTVNNVTSNDVPVKGLLDLAFKANQYIAGTPAYEVTQSNPAHKDALLGITAITNEMTGSTSADSYVYWDGVHKAWHFNANVIAEGYGTFGGINSDSGDFNISNVWESLSTNTDPYANEKIDPHHIPIGSGLAIRGDVIVAELTGTVPVSGGGTGLTSIPAFSLLYGSGNGGAQLALLAPNISATKKFLTMTGTGAAGATPVWGQVAVADISDIGSWSGSNNITTLGTITTGVWEATSIAFNKMAPTYIGTTQTQGSATGGQNLTGIGNLTASGLISTTNYVKASRFYLSDTVYFELVSGNVHLTATSGKPGFYAEGFGSFGGKDSGSGTADPVAAMWGTLTNNTGTYQGVKINSNHIDIGSGLIISSGKIVADGLAELKALMNGTNGVYFVRTNYSGGMTIEVKTQGSTYTKQNNHLYIEVPSSSS